MNIQGASETFSIFDETKGWMNLGHTMTDFELAGDAIEGLNEPYPAAALGNSISWSVDFALDPDRFDQTALKLYYGDAFVPDTRPRFSMMIKNTEYVPPPRHPWKGAVHGTGKRYRQSCRRWQRDLKRWKRSKGYREYVTWFPSVAISGVQGDYEVRA